MAMAESELNDRNAPVCSVCIANYNGLDIIAECIESVLAQDCGFPIEIIVHDDASTDGSVKLIRTRFPQVRLIESKENVGFCVSNNRMTATACGEFLLLLNNDASLKQGALRALLQNAAARRKPAILSLPQYNAETGKLIDVGCYLDPFLNPVPNLDFTQNEVGMVIGACIWIPRKLWLELGGFPEWFGSIAEDLYLCCLARLAGHPVQVVPESGYMHRVGYSFGGGKPNEGRLKLIPSRRSLSERNKSFVMITTYPAIGLAIAFPLHILLLILEGVTLSVLKLKIDILVKIYGRSIVDLWRFRHLLASTRKHNQSHYKAGKASFFKPFTCLPYKLLLLARFGIPKL
jgi:GT2 family glycosyltransferase